MEIQGHAHGDRSKVRRTDITRPNREAIANSNPPLTPDPETPTEAAVRESRTPDRVDVSETGRKVAERVETDRKDNNQRAERVAELKEAHARGELNSSARIEQAAARILESH